MPVRKDAVTDQSNSPGLAEYDIRAVTVEVPWDEASQGCEDIGYNLFDPAMVTKQTLVSKALLQEGERYWTSTYTSRSPFYWKLGCYDVKDRSSLHMTDFGSENSVYQCSQKCGDLQYIGLEDTGCFCFPASAKLSQESETPCTTLCPGNANEICGDSGSGKMSVYRKLDTNEDRVTLEGTTGDCVTLNKENVDAMYNYYSDDDEHQLFTDKTCTEKRTFFCRNYVYDPTKSDSDIFIYKPENKTWYEAQSDCLSSGNDLAFIDGSNAFGVLSRDTIPVGSESWVGLFRETAELSVAEGDVTGDLVSCNSISIDSNVLEERHQPCMNKLKTLCMKVSVDPTTTEMTSDYDITSEMSEAPITETPTTEESTTDAPTTNAPTTYTPTTDTPTTNAPTTDVPSTNAPTTDAPTTDVPSTNAPTTDVPTTDAPTTDTPTTDTPTTDAPTTEISSVASTEETTETPSIIQRETTDASTAVTPGSRVLNRASSSKTSTTIKTTTSMTPMAKNSVTKMTGPKATTEQLQPNAANVAEKKIGEDNNDSANNKVTGETKGSFYNLFLAISDISENENTQVIMAK
ncbi:Serum response factor-binding protein 1 [Mizuhopecten yessoensis]|uniref:Serum response factor-binding protein 1 n=1 Tax=Mizuhopecten yessoensis TaxID=6573 RepID=A0A210Q9D0_MIZYE|nr:Serum response factor-binding protein 1 [Mizuhopecten yessoensis]